MVIRISVQKKFDKIADKFSVFIYRDLYEFNEL